MENANNLKEEIDAGEFFDSAGGGRYFWDRRMFETLKDAEKS